MADQVPVTVGGQTKTAMLVQATSGGTGTTADQIQGNVAAAATDSGNPVKVGGVYSATLPTLTDGQRGNLQIGTRGSLSVTLMAQDSATAVGTLADNADAVAVVSTLSRVAVNARNYVYNGTTYDRARGDTVGSYVVSTPTTSANNAITPVVNAGVSSLVVKASPGNLYSATLTAGATAGFLIAYNATSAPAGGASLTGGLILGVVAVAAGATVTLGGMIMPDRFSVGITLLFSTSPTTYTIPANLAQHMKGSAV